MADQTTLTPKQQQIYDFIAQRIDDRGYPPTIRDIGKQFEIKSPNGVMCHLKALEKKGYIVRDGNSARAIRLMNRPTVRFGLPFKGLVAAGSPIPAEAQEERLDLHALFPAPGTFILQVRGQSMIENHIEDGDYVVIRSQEVPQTGDRVVARVDGEYTLKRFFKRKDQIELRPENDSMDPIFLGPGRDVQVVGVLVGVVRKC
jgi:repressor LexA